MYTEIRSDYIWGPAAEGGGRDRENSGLLAGISIDGWKTADDNEPGQVVVHVLLSWQGDILVDFHDNGARLDLTVNEHIEKAKTLLREIWQENLQSRCRDPRDRHHILEYRQVLHIPHAAGEQINQYLQAQSEDQYQGEDNTIIYTVRFPDKMEMDVKCCGCQDTSSWAEAVLFDPCGAELACTEVSDEFAGIWQLMYGGTLYTTIVQIEPPAQAGTD